MITSWYTIKTPHKIKAYHAGAEGDLIRIPRYVQIEPQERSHALTDRGHGVDGGLQLSLPSGRIRADVHRRACCQLRADGARTNLIGVDIQRTVGYHVATAVDNRHGWAARERLTSEGGADECLEG
jgi:hypothetical protein